MKKIMFSTTFGLQQEVFAGKKTMTRRASKILNHPLVADISEWKIYSGGFKYLVITYSTGLTENVYPPYQIGEEIAIAQPYKDICMIDPIFFEGMRKEPGWNNKMFVAAKYMPHRIRITDIKLERLKDISEEDATKEGIVKWMGGYIVTGIMENHGQNNEWFSSPRDAFFRLFAKLCGYKELNTNPWVFAYTFQLVQ